MPVYPSAYDSLPAPVDGVSEVLAADIIALADAIDHAQHALGLSGDTHSSSGSIYARVGYLEDQGGGIFKQASAPSSPATDALWLDTDDAGRPLYDFRSAAWALIGANALQVQGVAVDATAPTNAQVLTYNSTSGKWAAANATGGFSNPMTALGDVIYSSDSSGTPARLGIGSVGQALGVLAGPTLGYIALNFVPAPSGPQQGDVLYYNGTNWVRLAAGTTGQFLKTLGASSNPVWATPPSAAPGDGIPAPAGQTLGDILYFDGTDWVVLHADSGKFLKSNGAAAPEWATPASGSGLANPMTNTGDVIYSSDNSGTPARLGVGSTGQVLTVSGGAPAWATPAFVNPMTTAGDLIRGGSSGAPTRLAIGTNGQVLGVNGGALAWINNPAGFANPLTTRGDLMVYGASGTTRLALGTSGYALQSDGTDTVWAALHYQTVRNATNTGDMTPRSKLRFTGTALNSVTDDSGNDTTIVNYDTPAVFGASGTGHSTGVVPDPGSSAGSTKFLREDASWAVPSTSGGNGFTQPPTTSGASWLNQGSATATDLTRGIQISHPGGSGNNMRAVILEAAPSPSWTRYFMIDPVNTTGWYGIVLYSSGSGQMLTAGINCNGTTSIEIKLQRWTSFTTVNTTRYTETIFGPWPLWFRFADNGSNQPIDISRDGGQTWRNILNDASSWFTNTPTSLAFGADNNGIGSATAGVLRSYSSTAPDPTIVQ